jgi:hypothetical protein
MSELSSNNVDVPPIPSVQQEQPSLNIQDIVQLLNIVDVASRRGAFRAEELSSIGLVYDKISNFLKSTGAISPADEETQEPTGSKQ